MADAVEWRNRIVDEGDEPPDQLLASPWNWRTHGAAQRDAMRGALSQIGWIQRVVVNRTTGHVVDGHLRVEEAISHGDATIPVLYVELSEDEERLALATLDPIGAMAGADAARLDELLRDLNTGDEGLRVLLDDLARQNDIDLTSRPATDRPSLADRFLVPPFSVLDTRQGYWRARRAQWLALGIQSELGRGDDIQGSGANSAYNGSSAWADDRGPRRRAVGYRAHGVAATADPQSQQGLTDKALEGRDDLYGQAARRLGRASPSGSLKPAASGRDADGHLLGGDGRGRPIRGLARAFGQDLMRGEHIVGARPSARATVSQNPDGTLHYEPSNNGEGVNGTSIFDPVLCELVYRWFMPAGGSVLDPFAGGSVRGIVATVLGHAYTGVDLSAAQVAANEPQAARLGLSPQWVVGDSRDLPTLLPQAECDLVFTCPPYYNLEVYSDDPADLSNAADYAAFLADYRVILVHSWERLREDRYMVLVVSEVRERSHYVSLVADTVNVVRDMGGRLYNEAVLINSAGSLPIRVGRQFGVTRTLGRMHQNVLVFAKGDGQRAGRALGPVEVAEGPDEWATTI